VNDDSIDHPHNPSRDRQGALKTPGRGAACQTSWRILNYLLEQFRDYCSNAPIVELAQST
jgi:hypothetical protein